MRIEVKDNLKELSKRLSAFEKQYIPQATVMALNKIGSTVLSESKRRLKAESGLKRLNLLNKYVSVSRANRARPYFTIRFDRKWISMMEFDATQGAEGVLARAWGRRKMYKGAFIATMSNGKRDVFVRTGNRRGEPRRVKTGKNIGKLYRPGLPIKILYGPYLPTLKRQTKLDEMAAQVVSDRFGLEFSRAIRGAVARAFR